MYQKRVAAKLTHRWRRIAEAAHPASPSLCSCSGVPKVAIPQIAVVGRHTASQCALLASPQLESMRQGGCSPTRTESDPAASCSSPAPSGPCASFSPSSLLPRLRRRRRRRHSLLLWPRQHLAASRSCCSRAPRGACCATAKAKRRGAVSTGAACARGRLAHPLKLLCDDVEGRAILLGVGFLRRRHTPCQPPQVITSTVQLEIDANPGCAAHRAARQRPTTA